MNIENLIRNEDFNLKIAHIKLLQIKAKNWISEWQIIYVFFVGLFSFSCFYFKIEYIYTMATIFFVFTVLTYKLILIEKYRIKELDEILQDLLVEKTVESIFEEKKANLINRDYEFLEYLNEKTNIRYNKNNERQISYTVDLLAKIMKITAEVLQNIQKYDKKNN